MLINIKFFMTIDVLIPSLLETMLQIYNNIYNQYLNITIYF